MQYESARSSQIVFLAVIVVGLCAELWVDIQSQESKHQQAGYTQSNGSRLPASIAPDTTDKAMEVSNAVEILRQAVGCESSENHQPVTIRSDRLRWSGRVCGEKISAKDVEVTNAANQFSATVFSTMPGTFETDLIPLVQGKNEIHIRIRGKSAFKERLVTVLKN